MGYEVLSNNGEPFQRNTWTNGKIVLKEIFIDGKFVVKK